MRQLVPWRQKLRTPKQSVVTHARPLAIASSTGMPHASYLRCGPGGGAVREGARGFGAHISSTREASQQAGGFCAEPSARRRRSAGATAPAAALRARPTRGRPPGCPPAGEQERIVAAVQLRQVLLRWRHHKLHVQPRRREPRHGGLRGRVLADPADVEGQRARHRGERRDGGGKALEWQRGVAHKQHGARPHGGQQLRPVRGRGRGGRPGGPGDERGRSQGDAAARRTPP
jgi:hypothetical protein